MVSSGTCRLSFKSAKELGISGVLMGEDSEVELQCDEMTQQSIASYEHVTAAIWDLPTHNSQSAV